MSNSEKILKSLSSLIENGILTSKDIRKEITTDWKFKKDKIINKLELVSREEFEVLKKIVQKQDSVIKKLTKNKKNIEYHYDLGNSFYDKWLDQSMTYSSAYFDKDNQNLYDAQISKYDQIAKSLNLNENSKVLEIGCGWGGFSSYIAKNFKSKIDAITISKEQFEYASNKIQQEGLGEKVSIKYSDYRDVDNKYSNIASIEMFEAVGKKYWEKYFSL